MDPNETLRQIRIKTARILELHDDPNISVYLDELIELGGELAELNAALDEWIEKGGFLPEVWAA